MLLQHSRLIPGLESFGPLRCDVGGFQKWSHFWSPFGSLLGPKMDPKMGPKLVQNLVIFWSIFGSHLVEALELFGCLLGAFLGLLRLSWEPLDPKNIEKPMVFKVLELQSFGSVNLLIALLGSS